MLPHTQTQLWAPTAWVGIDVSKETLDVCLLSEQGAKHHGQFLNEKTGYAKMVKWVKRLAAQETIHFCVESTGAYSRAIGLFLVEAQQHVTVANPRQTKYAAMAQAEGNKTDKSDARVIAQWCRDNKPAPWRLTRSKVRELVALTHYLDALIAQTVQHKNRLSEPDLMTTVAQSLRLMLDQTQEQIKHIEQAIKELIDNDPDLRADRDLLVSIPGVAEATAARLLAELPDVSEFACAQSVARFAGLNPREFKSGSSVFKPTRLSKQGNSRLRAALYMPAMSARIHNSIIRSFYERLVSAGKSKMSALAAAMRKLLMIAYGVLRHRTPFDKNYLSAAQQTA